MLSTGIRAGCTVAIMALAVAGAGQGRALAQGIGAQVRAAEQPQLQAVDAAGAWKLSRGRGVTVGVLDTGVDAGAPDLAGSVTTGPDYTRGADPAGYQPPHLHGTYIASLIAGHGSGPGRAEGVIGIAPAARVLSVRVILDDQEPGFDVYNTNAAYDDAIGHGIRYAVGHGARVINMSLGSGQPTRALRQAVAYAIDRGVVVVASAGNSGRAGGGFSGYSYPASFTGVISVAAVNSGGSRASFSERNSSVVISAPGVNVLGAAPGGGYLQASGTSPAAAFVSGVAALIRARYPGLPPALVEQSLIISARHRPAGGYSPGTGFGEVNARDALRAAGRLASARPAGGLAATAHFGTGPSAIQVVHRDVTRIEAGGGMAAAGAAGFLAALVTLVVLSRRNSPGRRQAATGERGSAEGMAQGPVS